VVGGFSCSELSDGVRKRFGEEGELVLIKQRGDNGSAKANEDYILALIKAVKGTRKHSALFIELLKKLDRQYASKRVYTPTKNQDKNYRLFDT